MLAMLISVREHYHMMLHVKAATKVFVSYANLWISICIYAMWMCACLNDIWMHSRLGSRALDPAPWVPRLAPMGTALCAPSPEPTPWVPCPCSRALGPAPWVPRPGYMHIPRPGSSALRSEPRGLEGVDAQSVCPKLLANSGVDARSR